MLQKRGKGFILHIKQHKAYKGNLAATQKVSFLATFQFAG